MRPQTGERKSLSDNRLGDDMPSLAHHLPTGSCRTNPELAIVIENWDTLPNAVRAGIVAMVKAASGIR